MANEEKTIEVTADEVTTVAEDENVSEKKTSKVKEWFSRHKVGLTRVAKCAALVGGGLVAGVLLANKKKSDDEEMLELECGDWDDYDLPETESDDISEETSEES